jgi:plasmid stabilization system protein ParE
MSLALVFLKSAEHDLKDLKGYLIKNFDKDTWNTSYKKIKDAVGILRDFPQGGAMPEELESMNLTQYRQVISGMNRIIYEIRQETIYIHIVCDTRKDMKSLLTKRLLRIN